VVPFVVLLKQATQDFVILFHFFHETCYFLDEYN